MKLKKLLIVAASTLLLSACGGGTGAGTLPKGGQPATAASTVAAIGKAYESLTAMDLDAFETSLNLKKAKVNAKIATELEGGEGYTEFQAEASVKAKVAASGLQSETVAGLKAAVKVDDFNLDVYMGTEFEGQKETDVDLTIKDIDVAAYLANGNLYANISDPELREFIPTVLNLFAAMVFSSEQAGSIMDQIPNKIQLPGFISEDMLPLAGLVGGLVDLEGLPSSEELAAVLADTINEPVFAILEDYVTLLNYDDGSFGISIDLKKADVLSLIKVVTSLTIEGITSQQIELVVAEYAKVIEVKSLKATILLNKDCLPSDLLVDVDVSVDTSLSELMVEDGEIKLDLAVKADLKVKYGSNVTVVLPTDLGSYQVLATN